MDVSGTPVTLTESAVTAGTYEYAGIIAAGTYTITATATGYDTGTVSATFANGAQVAKTLAVSLTPPPATTTTTTTTVAATTTSTTASATTTTTTDPGATTTSTTAAPGTTTTTT